MENQFGSDFITIVDNDGVEYELEVVSTLEYNGATYLATMPASEDLPPEILNFRVEEDEEGNVLCFIEDEEEYAVINDLFLEKFFADDDEQ